MVDMIGGYSVIWFELAEAVVESSVGISSTRGFFDLFSHQGL